jgi:hypothetical protein
LNTNLYGQLFSDKLEFFSLNGGIFADRHEAAYEKMAFLIVIQSYVLVSLTCFVATSEVVCFFFF